MNHDGELLEVLVEVLLGYVSMVGTDGLDDVCITIECGWSACQLPFSHGSPKLPSDFRPGDGWEASFGIVLQRSLVSTLPWFHPSVGRVVQAGTEEREGGKGVSIYLEAHQGFRLIKLGVWLYLFIFLQKDMLDLTLLRQRQYSDSDTLLHICHI